MFILDNSFNSFYIVGIDPGSQTLGVAVIEVDIVSRNIVSTQACTFTGDKLYREDDHYRELYGDKFYRIDKHRENLTAIFRYVRPIAICCESPFYSQRRPSAFGVLMEVLTAIQEAVKDYNSGMSLHVIDPPNVKKAVGASGNADKESVKRAILKMPNLNFKGFCPLEKLDEHSIDAIGVAYYQYRALIG